ncbi:Cilia- and flagella-associated protein 251 [Bulinus truncatus]|nr:Cilia- and flagella-associated protein 251 [Bulinus truncatus]
MFAHYEDQADRNTNHVAEETDLNEDEQEEEDNGIRVDEAQAVDNADDHEIEENNNDEQTNEMQSEFLDENTNELVDQDQTEFEEMNNYDNDIEKQEDERRADLVDNDQNFKDLENENVQDNFEDGDDSTLENDFDEQLIKTPESTKEHEGGGEDKDFENNSATEEKNLQALREFSEAFANQILIAAQQISEEQNALDKAEKDDHLETVNEDGDYKGSHSTPLIDIKMDSYNTADAQQESDNEVDPSNSAAAYDKEHREFNKNANSGSWGGPASPTNFPSPNRSYSSIEGQMSSSALNIVWSFGLNRNVPVLNLSDGVRQAIMYSCAHVGIMYDYKNNKQHILQAHLNPITCSAVSQDKRWLVTGDVGPDAMVNIWDTYTGTPIQTMFDPNPKGGVVAVALTPDSRYLATLSALPIQTLAIWDWTVDGDVPICSADLKPEYGLQNFIAFDSTDVHHLVTNSESQVLFYHWEDNMIKYFAPPLSDSDFNKPVGRYSQSMYQIGIARALTATSIGNLVVWDNNRPLSMIMDVNQSADKKPLKIIKVHDKGINVLTNTDNYIVIGDTAGHIKFYDQCLRLIYWYQEFHSGPCTSISFAYMPDFIPIATEGSKYPSDATKQAKPFVIRDFIVGTSIAIYCSINTDGSKIKVIHREHDAAVHALAAHPRL